MQKKSLKSVHVLNLGCSKNQVDAEAMLGELDAAGIQHEENPVVSDILLINTCGFIEDAKEESIDEITSAVANSNPNQKVVVTGCLSQRYPESLQKEIPEVSTWLGTYRSGELVQALGLGSETASACKGAVRIPLGEDRHHAWMKIAEGCNRNCSFCAIPSIRGRQNSRNIPGLVQEARQLEGRGVRELSLVAQDLSFYGREKNGPGSTLTELLKSLLDETDIPWIRLMYLYPAFMGDDLLQLIADETRICSYLDMPLQHASDRMLQLMRRGHTRANLKDLLQKIRKQVPGIALRTTLLTGFPGEKEEDFAQLLELVEEFRFERLGVFTYSEEDGTSAAELKEKRVPEEVAEERQNQIMALQQEISLERNENLVGTTLEVIVDGVAEASDFHFRARSRHDAPEVDNTVWIEDGDASPGDILNVQVISASEYDLEAKMLGQQEIP